MGAGLEGTVKAICHQLRRAGGAVTLGGLQAAGPGVPECGRSGSGAGGGPAGGPAPVPAAARGYGCGAREQRPGRGRGAPRGRGGGSSPALGAEGSPQLLSQARRGDVATFPQLWGQQPPGVGSGWTERSPEGAPVRVPQPFQAPVPGESGGEAGAGPGGGGGARPRQAKARRR